MYNQNFEDEHPIQNKPQTLTQKNIKIVKHLMRVSPISMVFLIIIWIMGLFLAYQTGSAFWTFFTFSPEVLYEYGANSLFAIRNHQYFRFITAIILHGGFLHLVINTISFFSLILPMQAKHPWALFLLIILLGGIQGNMLADLSAAYFNRPYFLAVGSSTSICAVLGLYFAQLINKSFSQGLRSNEIKNLIINSALLLICSIMPGVDFYGHMGSVISGLLIGGSFLYNVEGAYQQNFKKLKTISRVAFGIYTLALLSIFFI